MRKAGGYLPAAALSRLDQACVVVGWAFDSTPYLVGSSLLRPDYRDVDVRVMLAADQFAALFPGYFHGWANPLFALLCSSISLHLQKATDLPIDFQLQEITKANEFYKSERHPLGIFPRDAVQEG